jgi:phytanoyl-CoA hydroxylase
VLFVHCLTLHAATRNYTQDSKQSVVFTFRAADNPPKPGTRSSSLPELLIH